MSLTFLKFRSVRRAIHPMRLCLLPSVSFCSEGNENDSKYKFRKPRYKIFLDEDSPIILDVAEEQLAHRNEQQRILGDPTKPVEEVIYKRGTSGVFDIEELIETLKTDNAKDIIVIEVPPELKYVDYLVIATGRSKRHLLGLAEYVRSVYKKKRDSTDRIPHIEGENSSEWVALDLGNIALHIMSSSARERYDLESLWCLGAKYDTLSQMEDDSILQLLKKHSITLDDIEPLKGG